jgi:hypothetical protein
LYTRVNLVRNIGFGVGATHTIFYSFTAQLEAGELAFPIQKPGNLATNFDFIKLEAAERRDAWVKFSATRPVELGVRLLKYAVERLRRLTHRGLCQGSKLESER